MRCLSGQFGQRGALTALVPGDLPQHSQFRREAQLLVLRAQPGLQESPELNRETRLPDRGGGFFLVQLNII